MDRGDLATADSPGAEFSTNPTGLMHTCVSPAMLNSSYSQSAAASDSAPVVCVSIVVPHPPVLAVTKMQRYRDWGAAAKIEI